MSADDLGPLLTEPVPASPTDPLVGRVLAGRYEIIEQLGQGGMATAYLASDRGAGQKVVVKVPRSDLARELAQDLQLIERFESEAGAQAALDHAHIVRIRDRSRVEVDGVELPFVVVDFKGGGDLEGRLRSGPQTYDEVLDWLRPVALALDFSHGKGWVHRDVKPDNILFDAEGFVYLSDFGIAKLMPTDVATVPDSGAAPNTIAGRAIGTPGYMPPEAMLREYTPAYDQFSLAVVVAQALAGKRPRAEGVNSCAVELLDVVPKGPAGPVRRALSAKPEQRFESCVAFADALRDEAAKRGGAPLRNPILAVVGALVLAAGAWLALRDAAPPATGPGETIPAEEPALPREVSDEPVPVPPAAAPRRFELGSSAEERSRALELCEAHLESGCDPSWYADETPRRVELPPFTLDPREVTVGEFRAFIGERATRAEERGTSRAVVGVGNMEMAGLSWRAPGWEPADDEPVVHVTRSEAAAYCASLDKRLPTEDEWEAGARGQSGRAFPWGAEWEAGRARWLGSQSVRKPAPVGQFPPAPDGIFDLAGNVWEWTATPEGSEPVLKGGSWAELNPASLRGATKLVVDEDYTSEDAGFRCARDVDQWPDA